MLWPANFDSPLLPPPPLTAPVAPRARSAKLPLPPTGEGNDDATIFCMTQGALGPTPHRA